MLLANKTLDFNLIYKKEKDRREYFLFMPPGGHHGGDRLKTQGQTFFITSHRLQLLLGDP